jgi:hypothetical protein
MGDKMKPSSSAEVREHLVRALQADLIGPFDAGHPDAVEELPLAPSRWYLTGFLAPEGAAEDDAPPDDEFDAGNDEDDDDSATEKPDPKPRMRAPASLGLSVLLPPGDASDTITVTLRYADYLCVPAEQPEGEGENAEPARKPKARWRRVPQARVSIDLPLDPKVLPVGWKVPESRGIWILGHLQETSAPGLEPGTRALALFVVNRRGAEQVKARQDEQVIFQVELGIRFAGGLVPRPNRRDEHATDWDDKVADLQYRDRMEYAVGHGVSAEAFVEASIVTGARTCWIPRATVPRVVTHELPDVTTEMDALAALTDAGAARQALDPLVAAYGVWLEQQRGLDVVASERRKTQEALLLQAERCRSRIARGIALLEEDPDVFAAFRLANRAMAMSARRRSPDRYEGGQQPRWRLFQLAFLLLNVAGIAVEGHEDRDVVELIFFPTGGGKTEAYLGVIAFTLILRRLRGACRPDRGLGVAVLLRYTLRLLTLDQLSRAATLMCALEMLRRAPPGETPEAARLGDVRFSIGLWVGRSATANTMDQVAEKITEYKNSTSTSAPSPFPLPECPWCNKPLKKDSLTLVPNRTQPREVVVGCSSFSCDFAPSKNPGGIPVLFVDEPIYRELPCFLIATVDKFAMLPWRGETGALFGRVHAHSGREFFGPMDGTAGPKGREKLPEGLRPPELIVQDELHLISGPLGTMVGLYETAIDALCTYAPEGAKPRRPKILASTATVRRAREQIRSLFGRAHAVFPPPGIDDTDNFFARVDPGPGGRLYIGVAAPGRAMKAILLRTYVGLLGAAQRCWSPGPRMPANEAADPYMTIAGYFNSLRELGGMRRLVEDEVRSRSSKNEERRPLGLDGAHPWLANRDLSGEPVELTSRESTYRIAESKSRLGKPHADSKHVDVLLASNMISVGVDIDRLGLMVIAGQPKSTSEYIQASSRVGRNPEKPGLVVTVFNCHKPRDRSHYERFTAYHESFYRFVEATSLTPFSGPALERGLAGVLVAMIRLLDPAMTPADAVMAIEPHRAAAERAVRALAERGARERPGLDGAAFEDLAETLTQRGKNLLDAWQTIIARSREGAAKRRYSALDRHSSGKPLIYSALDEDIPPPGSDEAKFVASTSMRDVEASVHLWRQRRNLSGGQGS